MAYLAAAAAIVQLGYDIYANERQATQQRRSLAEQKKTQAAAESRAVRAERMGEEQRAAANRRQVDPAQILAAMQTGGQSTLLSGRGGAPIDPMALGRSRLLGD